MDHKKLQSWGVRGLIITGMCISFQGVAFGQTLYELLPDVLQTHDKIRAAGTDLEATKESANAVNAAWYPTLDFKWNAGHETQDKDPSAVNTHAGFWETTLTAKQLVWDFGKTSATTARAGLMTGKSSLMLESTRQQVLLEATEAYFNLLRAVESMGYAMRSESNIKQQTNLEEARVERGRGIAADVLQAKSTLAGAMAMRVQAQGGVDAASNRYRSVFKREVGDMSTFRRPLTPYDKLPQNLEEAIEIALANNLNMKMAQVDIQSAQETVKVDESTLYAAKIDATLQGSSKDSVGGVMGRKEEYLAKVELNIPLFAGGKDQATYRASSNSAASTISRKDDLARSVEEQVRNAWQALRTQRDNAFFLRNQANISGEFLDMARKERQMGRRSLLDILNSETGYINSVSAAVSAETDTSLAVYRLLFVMGQLDPELFGTSESDDAVAARAKDGAAVGSDGAATAK